VLGAVKQVLRRMYMVAERVAGGMLEVADEWAIEGSSIRAIVEDKV